MTAVAADLTNTRPATVRRGLLVALALGQLAAPFVIDAAGGGAFTTADRSGEPPIVPAGYAFSIWGLIEAFSLAYAVWAFSDRRPDPALRDQLAVPLLVTFAGFSAWLVAAELEPTWATLVVFLVMLASLLRALDVALDHRAAIARWSRAGRVLLWGTLGLYTGWSSIAIWINLTTALTGSGLPLTGTAAVVGQLGILAGATATAVLILRWTRGLVPYALAVGWAFVGAILGAAGAGQPILAGASVVGLAVSGAVFVLARRSGGRRRQGAAVTGS